MDSLNSLLDFKEEYNEGIIRYLMSINDLINIAGKKKKIIPLHYIEDLSEELIIIGNSLLRKEEVSNNVKACNIVISSKLILDSLNSKNLLSNPEFLNKSEDYDVELFQLKKYPQLKYHKTLTSQHLGIYSSRKKWESDKELRWFSKYSFPIDLLYADDFLLGNHALLVFTTIDANDEKVDYCYLASFKEDKKDYKENSNQTLGCAKYVADLLISSGLKPINDYICENI